MNVLITNDDGIYAEGLWALYRAFIKSHSVTVVAPERERSAVSHSITLHKPLRVNRVCLEGGLAGYAVNGTPADCVKLGILEIIGCKPDIVLSGINPGANIGINLNYSGTVAAAKEASLYGISAIAISIQGYVSKHLNDAAVFGEKLARKVIETGLPSGVFLNVNFPDTSLEETAGIKISKQDLSVFPEFFEKRIDPRNRTYYWQGISTNSSEYNPDTDGAALSDKYISITPIKCDMTDYDMIEELKAWDID
ncbi:MAG: 5'/3'-nucleotidase SurE [Proteobacteria bacterium]|nr:5'/3'-nucleotidase SurE [Pseudomonadota bacterium]